MKLKVFPLYTAESGCQYHRIRLPMICSFEYIDDDWYRGYDWKDPLPFFEKADVVIWNRSCVIPLESIQELRLKYGFKIVVDLDDWIKLPEYHLNYKEYREKSGKIIIDNIKMADAVTVTTERLYNKVKEFNKNTFVIPNALPFDCYGEPPLNAFQFRVNPEIRKHDYFDFIYTGQSSHLEDVRLMQSDVNRMKKHDVGFTMCGYVPGAAVTMRMSRVFEGFKHYSKIKNQPLDRYMRIYDQSHCLVVPLCINDFNSCKSNLKILEAGAKKIPAIVSHVPPYSDDKDAPVLWVKQPGDWYKHMKYLSDNPNKAEAMGKELHDWAVEKYSMQKWNKERFELYQSIVDSYVIA